MKKLMIILLLIATIVGVAYAAATSETGDSRAVPQVGYGKTSSGALTPILVASDGTLQIS